MRHLWTAAALLCSGLLVGCGDRSAENPQDLQQPAPIAEETTPNPQDSAPAELLPAPPEVASPSQDVRRPAAPPQPSASRPAPDRPASPATEPSRAPAGNTPTGNTPGTSASRAPETTGSPAAARSSTPPPRLREVVVPANTALPLELTTAVSSETAQVETPVRARLRNALRVDGETVLPAGAVLHGNVIDVVRAGRVQGRSRLVLRFNEVELDGGREQLRTNPIAFEGEATRGEDATKVGAGAVGGAIVGGIIGGGSGAATGAAIGAAAGTGAVLATRGREVTLAAGTDLAATLATPFSSRVEVR